MIKNLIFTFGLTVCILEIVSYTNWNLILRISIKKNIFQKMLKSFKNSENSVDNFLKRVYNGM